MTPTAKETKQWEKEAEQYCPYKNHFTGEALPSYIEGYVKSCQQHRSDIASLQQRVQELEKEKEESVSKYAFDIVTAQSKFWYDETIRQAERLQELERVIKQLVELKDIHDDTKSSEEQKRYYAAAKPIAWKEARDILYIPSALRENGKEGASPTAD